MCKLMLIRPSKIYEKQVMSYKEEMSQSGDSFDGCAGLEDVDSFDEWIDFENRLKNKYGAGYVPSEVFLAVRKNDNFVEVTRLKCSSRFCLSAVNLEKVRFY